MGIRPGQLTDPQLKVVFGGVSREEVLAVLADARDDYQALLAEIDRLRSQLAEATARLVSVHADERETTRTISRAEQEAGTIRQSAQLRAEGLQQEAEAKATALLAQAEAERDALEAHIARLAGGRARLHRVLETEVEDLRAFLSAGPQVSVASLPATPAAAATPGAPWLPSPAFEPEHWELAGELEALDVAVDVGVAALEAASPDPAEDGPVPEQLLDEAWSAEDIESALMAVAIEPPAPAIHEEAARLEQQAPEPIAEEQQAPEPIAEEPPAPASPAITAIAADPRYAAAVQAFLQDESALEDEDPPRRLMPRLAMAAAGLAAVGIVAVLAFPRSTPQAVEASPRRTAPAWDSTVTRPDAAAVRQPPVGTSAPASARSGAISNQPPAGAAPLVVRLEARRPCWVGVTIGDRKESRLLGQGEEIVREASSDVILRVGDAGALIVTVNDRRLPPLGADGEVVTRRVSVP